MSTPQLRFKDDDGREFPAWKEKKICELFQRTTHSSKSAQLDANGKYIVVDMGSISREAKLLSSKYTNISNDALTINDLVMAKDDIGGGNIIGRVVRIPENDKYVCSDHVYKLTIKNGYTGFFYYAINSYKINKSFREKANGTAQIGISSKTVDEQSLPVPRIKEQTKIANFLTTIDEKITQLTQKCILLAQYKKGVMQQIFSQKLRFKNNDGREFSEWEEKQLGSVCVITTGKLDANAMVENGEYRFYTCAKDYFFIDKYAFDTDALLISGNGNVGYIQHYQGKFNAYQRTYVLDMFNQNIIFIKYFLEKNLHTRISKEKNVGSIPYIVMGTLTKMTVSLPAIKEQTKIANFLAAIDNKITHTQTQLKAVKQYKKGLLQQMFV